MADNCQSTYLAIDQAWRKLNTSWLTACEQWRDGAHQRFDQEFWAVFTQTIPEFQNELQSLSSVLDQARHTVE
jgi:hypothetical protein